jgi:hypothetical protein
LQHDEHERAQSIRPAHGSESRLTKHIGCLRNLSSWLK